MALGRILQGFITILVGVNLAPAVANGVNFARQNGGHVVGGQGSNVTGASGTILGLVTLFFVLGVMTAGVQIAVGGLADVGLI